MEPHVGRSGGGYLDHWTHDLVAVKKKQFTTKKRQSDSLRQA